MESKNVFSYSEACKSLKERFGPSLWEEISSLLSEVLKHSIHPREEDAILELSRSELFFVALLQALNTKNRVISGQLLLELDNLKILPRLSAYFGIKLHVEFNCPQNFLSGAAEFAHALHEYEKFIVPKKVLHYLDHLVEASASDWQEARDYKYLRDSLERKKAIKRKVSAEGAAQTTQNADCASSQPSVAKAIKTTEKDTPPSSSNATKRNYAQLIAVLKTGCVFSQSSTVKAFVKTLQNTEGDSSQPSVAKALKKTEKATHSSSSKNVTKNSHNLQLTTEKNAECVSSQLSVAKAIKKTEKSTHSSSSKDVTNSNNSQLITAQKTECVSSQPSSVKAFVKAAQDIDSSSSQSPPARVSVIQQIAKSSTSSISKKALKPSHSRYLVSFLASTTEDPKESILDSEHDTSLSNADRTSSDEKAAQNEAAASLLSFVDSTPFIRRAPKITTSSTLRRAPNSIYPRFLVQKNRPDIEEATIALKAAVERNDPAAAQSAIDRGADLKGRSSVVDWTPLHECALRGNVDVMEVLLRAGADLEKLNCAANRALHIAVIWGSEAVVSRLIEAGADLHAVGSDGRTPLQWAVQQNKPSIAALLRSSGALR